MIRQLWTTGRKSAAAPSTAGDIVIPASLEDLLYDYWFQTLCDDFDPDLLARKHSGYCGPSTARQRKGLQYVARNVHFAA